VTTSVVLGRPPRAASGRGGGGDAGRFAAVGFVAVAWVVAARGFRAFAGDDFADLAFVALAFFGAAVVALGLAADDFVALGFARDDFVALAVDVVVDPRRSPPMRVGRLDLRLPRTLGSDEGLAAFFVFFFAVFSAMRKKVARGRVLTGYSDAATRSVTAPVRKK
jgi:hypothetical protein